MTFPEIPWTEVIVSAIAFVLGWLSKLFTFKAKE